MVMASWVSFATIDEPATRQRGRPRSLTLAENLRAIPQLIAGNRQVVLFLGARFFRSGMFILLPFLAICFRDRLHRSDEFLAHLVIVQMIGAVLGNVAAGFIGDRFGSKVTMLVGTVLFAGLSAWSMVATTSLAFQTIFFLVGFAQNGAEVGNQALGLGVCPAANRSTILAVIALASLPSLLLASWINQRLWLAAGSGQRLTGLGIATVVALVLSAACLLPVRDPRHAPE
jgi:predicted MFS family arabinose efflux permease